MNKRVTITVEILDPRHRVVWSQTETAEYSTGGNPLHHWSDIEIAINSAARRVIASVIARFGDFREL